MKKKKKCLVKKENTKSITVPGATLCDDPVLQMSRGMDSNDWWEIKGQQMIKQHVKLRTSLCDPRFFKELPIHIRRLNVTREIRTYLDDESEAEINDVWYTDEAAPQIDLSGTWIGRTMFTIIQQQPVEKGYELQNDRKTIRQIKQRQYMI